MEGNKKTYSTLLETNMAMENKPFEDVFPIENGDVPLLCLITGVYQKLPYGKNSQTST